MDTTSVNKRVEFSFLDGLRGWASLAVFAHHFLLSFYPQVQGILANSIKGWNIKETPFFIFINGPAAVMVFLYCLVLFCPFLYGVTLRK